MKNIEKLLIGLLILVIIGILFYVWFIIAVGAVSFIITIMAVAFIVFGLFRFKYWLKRKNNKKDIARRNDNSEYVNQRSKL